MQKGQSVITVGKGRIAGSWMALAACIEAWPVQFKQLHNIIFGEINMPFFTRSKHRFVAIGAVIAAVTSGAAHAENLTISAMNPAKNSAAASVSSVMVERFDGPDGTELSFAIEKALRSAKIDGRPYFQMTADSSWSEAVISGTARVSVDEFDQYQARTKCVELDANDQCIKSKEIKVLCTNKVMSLTSAIRLTTTDDGSIIYSSNKGDQKEIIFCPDVKATLTTESQIQSMIDDAARSVRRDLAPRQYDYKVALQERRKGLPSQYSKAFKAAVKLSRSNQTASCAAFNDLYVAAPEARSVIYNAAICAERAGDFDRAIELFTKGIGRYSLSNSPTESRDRVLRVRKNYLAAIEQINVR